MNIIVISPAPWDFPIWTNRQHISNELSKKHRVVYLFHSSVFISSIKRKICKKKIKNLNVELITPIMLPLSNIINILHRINIKLSSYFLIRYLRKNKIKEYIIWLYCPDGVYYLNYLTPLLSCYDCVDEYSTMPSYNTNKKKKRIQELETKLLRRCDLVFTTSENLYKSKIKQNINTYLVENVGDFEHFNKAAKPLLNIPSDMNEIDHPIIGFIGAIDDYKVDFDLIEFLAKNRPNWQIVLIGGYMRSNSKKENLPNYDNLHLLGRKNYDILPIYLSKFDICIIPYKINDYTNHVFPLKLFEYLSSGKPVISTDLPSLHKYKDYIDIANTYEMFINKIEECIAKPEGEKIKLRIKFARKNSWEKRSEKLLHHVQKALKGKSI